MSNKGELSMRERILAEPTFIWLIVGALIAQTPTAAYFFHKIQMLMKPEFHTALNWALAIFYAGVAEFATFVWTIKGKEKYAWGYCVISVLINLTGLAGIANGDLTPSLIFGGILISIVPPVSVVLFSKEFANRLAEYEQKQKKNDIISTPDKKEPKYMILKKVEEE